ncbi:ABC transporter substrate-binding protein [Paraburkholderia fungorum]|uniref:ABC transporter substrate-binding protein n=1 Tax=Paraburkholderia fungorum TaxID=134537 RepID=UPI0020931C1A|nr:ABC transporter substrate-binding protein [Paraburkholderia fungorum]USU18901.1 ABC transporter substrate-binding protein [Paraburkholderia fungorum]USU29103.1 ABC transporter substrate-binding protein [Paraburkholderia fungorum]
MKKYRLLLLAVAAVAIVSACTSGRPITSVPQRIGFVAGAGGFQKMAVTNQAFFDALAESGYANGKTLDVIFRTADGDMARMPSLVNEVLSERVDILVVSSSPGCAAAKAATTTVPILCISVQDDPVKAGLTQSLTSPSGNIVGVHSYLADGISQQLDWLGRFVPHLTTLAVLYNPQNATHARLLSEWAELAGKRSIRIVPMPVVKAGDIDAAVKNAIHQNAQIAIGLLGADTYALRKNIAESASANHFPIAMDTPGGYTQLGGVATVGVDIVPLYRKGALDLMVPMLRGKHPSDLAWIGPDRVSVKVNRAVARTFGLSIPDDATVE